MNFQEALASTLHEYNAATRKFKPFNSAHEGYAVLAEEVDELWEEVKKKPSEERKNLMRAEAIQVAAMALRFLQDCC
jgi:hypothetical protein